MSNCAKYVLRFRNRRGIALLLVLPAVALVTVLAYAVLSNTGNQEQISANSASIAQADLLAEAGVNYAMYNLQHPSYAPTFTGSFWPGPSGNISLGASVPGTFNVSVSQSGSNYVITSTATVTGSNGTTIIRTINTTVKIATQAVQPNQAAGINGNVTLGSNMTINGDIRTTGSVTLNSGSSITGDVYSTALTLNGGSNPLSFVQVGTSGVTVAPSTVTNYLTYTLNGVSYSAKQLTTDPVAGTVLGPTATNPAGIYYTQKTTTTNLNGVTINGTLIVKKSGASGGSVTVTGTAANTITPMSGFPGLVVDSNIIVSGTNKQLTVNGLAWAGTGMTGSGSNAGSTVTINGSLLIPSTVGIGAYSGALNLNYNQANVAVSNFSTQMQVPMNITMVNWSEQ
jgi:Tfp pilus assembly protein PilX